MNENNLTTEQLIQELIELRQQLAVLKTSELQRQQMEAELRASEDRYRFVVENQSELICRFRPNTTLTFVNDAYCSYFGKTREELLGTSYLQLIPERTREAARQRLASFLGQPRTAKSEQEVCLPSGKIAWQQWVTHAIVDGRGTVQEFLSVGRDITKRKLAEEALRESAAQYRTLVEGSVQGISIVSRDRIRLFANAAHARIFGYENPQDLIGKSVIECIAPHDRDRVYSYWQQYGGEDAPIRIEYQGVRRDGSLVWLETMSSFVSWEGKPARLMTMVDITERKQAEQERLRHERQLQQAQKLESLGLLAGGVAHDFNNLLTGILTNAGTAQRELAADHPVQTYLTQIALGSKLAAHLTGQLLAYAGKGRLHIHPLDLSAEVERVEPLLQSAVRGKAHLVFDLAPELPAIEADLAQLQQILLNLVINAAECTEDDVTIRIKTDVAELNVEALEQMVPGSNMHEGIYVTLEVADDGCGMDEKTRQCIFDPFFTTKATGRGLGLAATLGIVHGHGGGLQLTSTPNVGTTFRIFFPTSEKAVEVAPQEDQRDPFGHGLVLVVDDDEYVIQAAYVALKSFGYSVIVAEDGYKAVEIFRSRGAEIDLVVLDLTMPGMRGDETLHALRDLRPEVKVLLSTAYDEEETARQVATTDVVDFLQKPYDPNRLAIKVKQLLEGGEAPLPAVESDRSLSAVRATYRQRLPGRLQALAAALQAAQTDGGSDETVQQAFHLAHRLKGTVGSYGFDVIAETLESIEETLQKMQLGQIAATAAEWSKLQDTLNRGQASLE